MAMERAHHLLIVNADDFGLAPGVTRAFWSWPSAAP